MASKPNNKETKDVKNKKEEKELKKANKKEAKELKKNSKDKRHFMKDFKAELKKVIWPTPKELASNTIAVITIVALIAVIVLGLDTVFKTLNDQGINKLRTVISSDNTTNNTTSNTTNNTTNQLTGEEVNAIIENAAAAANETAENTNAEE